GRVLEAVQDAEPSRDASQCLRQLAEPRGNLCLLEENSGLSHGILAPLPAGVTVRPGRLVELAQAHEDVSQSLVHRRAILCADAGADRGQRALEEPCGLDVRIDPLGALTGDA